MIGMKTTIFRCSIMNFISSISIKVALRRVPEDLICDKSTWIRIYMCGDNQFRYWLFVWRQTKSQYLSYYDDVIKWKHFPRYWPFVRGIHRPPVNSPHKGQWRGALMFSLICAWINRWLSKQSWGWWFETLLRPLWCQCNMLTLDIVCHQANFSKQRL